MNDIDANRQFVPRMIIIITREEDKKKLEDLFDRLHLPICCQWRGKGTAPSEMLDIFGLSGSSRIITLGILPKFMVRELTHAVEKCISFRRRGGGIIMSIPITGMQNPIFQSLKDDAKEAFEQQIKERTEQDMDDIKSHMDYVMIWVSVAGGYSDEVIDAAREAGAKGGTVLKGRQRYSERFKKRFGISVQEERDFVLIVVPREKKKEIMSAIGKTCGLASDAHGMLLSLPVDEVFGLEV